MSMHSYRPVSAILVTAATIWLAALLAVATTAREHDAGVAPAALVLRAGAR